MSKKAANVLILTSTYPRWERDTTTSFVAEFAKRIAAHTDNVYVLAPHFKAAKPREVDGNLRLKRFRYFFPASGEDIVYNGGGVTRVKKSPLYAVKLLFFIVSLFFNTLFTTLRRNVTIINAHWLVPQGFVGVLVKFLTGRTLVITVHGGDVLSLNGKYMRAVKRFTLRHADVVYVNSSVTRAACLQLCEREYQLIPMGIDIAYFQSAKPSAELKKQYGLSDFTILFTGRLTEAKGVIYLLEALVKLKKSNRKFKALIAGTGPLAEKLQEFINDNSLQENVTMLGWVDASEIPAHYATADVFVGPSIFEAQGLVFIEALAAGLPVITTDQGGMSDFIKNGENGFMVSPKSPEALYEVLAKLHDDRKLLKKLSSQAPTSIAHDYSWDAVTEHYLESWKEFMS
jgi:glycosyltransferase involved in cell wall biosynthesis